MQASANLIESDFHFLDTVDTCLYNLYNGGTHTFYAMEVILNKYIE